MNNIGRHATEEQAVSSRYGAFNAPMAAENRTDMRISIRHGTNGAQWHNVALEGDAGAAQVVDYAGLNGGPCRDRTYDQLIKSGHFLYD
jgi:hypothetical protein